MTNVRQPVRFQNSYRLESSKPFNREEVFVVLKETMDEHFSKIDRFDSRITVASCRSVTDDIIEKIKEKQFDR